MDKVAIMRQLLAEYGNTIPCRDCEFTLSTGEIVSLEWKRLGWDITWRDNARR